MPLKSDFVTSASAPVEPAGADNAAACPEMGTPAEEAVPYGPRIAYLRLRKEKLKNGRGRNPGHERRPFPSALKPQAADSPEAKDGTERAVPPDTPEAAERKQDT